LDVPTKTDGNHGKGLLPDDLQTFKEDTMKSSEQPRPCVDSADFFSETSVDQDNYSRAIIKMYESITTYGAEFSSGDRMPVMVYYGSNQGRDY
jgi:hypothetical protein